MSQDVNRIGVPKDKNFKNNIIKSKSPKLISNIIQKNINKKNNVDEKDNCIINNHFLKKIKLDKNIFFLKNNHEQKTTKTDFESDKMKSKRVYINIKNIINNKFNKYPINNKQKETRKNKAQNENIKISSEKNNEVNEIKTEKEKEQKPEDISDYIDLNEKNNIANFDNMDKKITYEAIEEVDEAKEMSELKQPSELMSVATNSKQSKSSVKNSDSNKNKTDYENRKYNKINLKNKSYKMSLNKKITKKISLSPPLKRIDIGFPKQQNSSKNMKKNNLKLNKYKDNNINNYSIFYKNNDVNGSAKAQTKYIIIKKNQKGTQKHQFKSLNINKRNKNILDLNQNSNNKSNINIKDNKETQKILKTESKSKSFPNSYNSSKTTPNIKNIVNNKRLTTINKQSIDNQSQSNSNVLKKIKIDEKKSSFKSGYIYNSRIKSLSIESHKKKVTNNRRELSKKNKYKKIQLFDDKDKKLNRTSDIDINKSSYKYNSFDRIKLTINKIKNSEDKYNKLFTDYYLREAKNKNRNFIKEVLINNGNSKYSHKYEV